MEEAERTKKLLAGKEKLAAFQKKRSKRKKKTIEGGKTGEEFSDCAYSETSSLADLNDLGSTSDLSDTASVTFESDRGSVTGDGFEEEGEPRQSRVGKAVLLVRARGDLRKASARITELEEILYGKQDAMTRLTEENDRLREALVTKTSIDNGSDHSQGMSATSEDRVSTPDKEPDEAPTDEAYQHKLSQFESALKQRDEVIKQLTANLKATTESRATLQQEYTAQAAELARQVHTLQLQLQQAGDWLKNRMGEHGISAQALLEAKNELLALQQVNLHKENELAASQADLKQRDEMLQRVVEQYNTAAQQAHLLHQEYIRLQELNTQHTTTIEQLTFQVSTVQQENFQLTSQAAHLTYQSQDGKDTEVEDTNQRLATVQQALQENEQKIGSLEEAAKDRVVEVEKLKEALRLKDQSLQQMVLSLSGVSESNKSTETDISTLQLTINQQKEEIETFHECVHQKDHALQQLTEKFSETSQQLNILYQEVSALKAKEQDVVVLRETIREREEKLVIIEQTIRLREEKLQEREERWRLVEQGSHDSKPTEYKDLAEKLSLLETQLWQKDQSLVEKDRQIQDSSHMFTEVLQENKHLKEVENEQHSLMMKIAELTHQLESLSDENRQLKEAEKEIVLLAQKIPQLKQEMVRLSEENKVLREKETEMSGVVEQMREREKILVALDEENKSLKSKIKEMKQIESELAEKANLLKSSQEEITRLQDIEKQNSVLQDEFKKKTEEHAFFEEQVRSMQSQLHRAETQVSSAQQTASATSQIIDKLASLEQDVAQKEEEVRSVNEKLLGKDKTLSEFSKEISGLMEQNGRLQQEVTDLKFLEAKVKEKEHQVLTLRDTVAQRDSSIEELSERLANQKEEIDNLDRDNKIYKEKHNEMVSLQELLERREAELTTLKNSEQERGEMARELTAKVATLTQEVSQLTYQVQQKEEASEVWRQTLQQKESAVAELLITVDKLGDDIKNLTNKNQALQEKAENLEMLRQASESAEDKDIIIGSLQEKVSTTGEEVRHLKEAVEQREASVRNLSQEIQNINRQILQLEEDRDEALRTKEEEVSQKQEEVDILDDIIRQRDESLQNLTESMDKLNEDLVQLSTENTALRSQGEELLEKQDQFLSQLSDLNQKFVTLKDENSVLMLREQELHNAQEELSAIRETLQAVRDEATTLQAEKSAVQTKNEELVRAQTDLQGRLEASSQQAGEIQQLKDKNEAFRMEEAQIESLQEAIRVRDLKNSALQERVSSLTMSLEELTQKSGESKTQQLETEAKEEFKAPKDQQTKVLIVEERITVKEEELLTMQQLNDELHRKQSVLQSPSEAKERESQQLAKDEVNQPLTVQHSSKSEAYVASDGAGIHEATKEHSRGLGTSMVDDSEPKTASTEIIGEDLAELQKTIEQKDRDIITLHQTIQVQQQSLQEMHSKMTELSQYVNYLGQENQVLKVRESEIQAEVERRRAAGVEDSGSHASPNSTPEHAPSQESVAALQTYVEQQNATLEDMTKQVMALSQENLMLKARESQEVQSTSTELSAESKTEEVKGASSEGEARPSKTESQANITALHAYIQQQNAHIEELTKRTHELTNYIAQLQDEYAALKNRDSIKEKEVERLKVESSESLTKLDEENENLKRKESESNKVVEQLMSDIENLRRSESPATGPPTALQVGSVSVEEHSRALETLRAELEELHGGQIVEMKRQVREQMGEQMEALNQKLKTLEQGEVRVQNLPEKTDQESQAEAELSEELEKDSYNQQIEHLHSVIKELMAERDEVQRMLDQKKREWQCRAEEESEAKEKLLTQVSELVTERDEAITKAEQLEQWSWENAADTQEDAEAEIGLLRKRISELISERDQALTEVNKVKSALPLPPDQTGAASPSDEDEAAGKTQLHSQVKDLSEQLQKLAMQRDDALGRIQLQQQQLEKSLIEQQLQEQHAAQVQGQQDAALQQEIASLHAQLRDVTTAKEEALHQVHELKRRVEIHHKDSSPEAVQKPQDSPAVAQRKKSPPTEKPLSPMQQQLLHLQKQLLEPEPAPRTDDVNSESVEEARDISASPARTPPSEPASAPTELTTQLQLKQMQELYDEHNKHQAHEIENLTAELRRINREREEAMAQLEQYQSRFESHVKHALDQQQKQHAEKLQEVSEELEKHKQTKEESEKKFEKANSQSKTKIKELTEQLQSWQTKYYQAGLQMNGDSSVLIEQLRAENSQFQDQIAEFSAKVSSLVKEKEETKAELKEAKIAIYDLEGKNPDVGAYRRRLEDLDATLKVTWIENEELKASVASLKEELQKVSAEPQPEAHAGATNGNIPGAATSDSQKLKARLQEAELELEKLHALVGVDVIVLSRQVEEARHTYSQQLQVHSQELTAVKRELARYQTLDSDSDFSPIHTATPPFSSPKKLHKGGKQIERSESLDSINVELSRVHAQHELEVESLKKSKGEFADELYAEKERHRDAMARMEQLLRRMVRMQQKHKEETDSLKENHEESLQEMSLQLQKAKAEYEVMMAGQPANGTGSVTPGTDDELQQAIAMKEKLRAECEKLKLEKCDWDLERDRLKARTGQLVGEKDLLVKERDALTDSVEKMHSLLTSDCTAVASEQQRFDTEEFDKKQGKSKLAEKIADIEGEIRRLRPYELEVTRLHQLQENVTVLQTEQTLLTNVHQLEVDALQKQYAAEHQELKQKLDQLTQEKKAEIEQHTFDMSELQTNFETLEGEKEENRKLMECLNDQLTQLQDTIDKLQQEKKEMVEVQQSTGSSKELELGKMIADLQTQKEEEAKEFSEKIVSCLADWKMEREMLTNEFEAKLKSRNDEIQSREEKADDLRRTLEDTKAEANQLRADGDAMSVEYEQVVQTLQDQQVEVGRLQSEYSRIKEERDTLHNEHMKMLETIHKGSEETIQQLTDQIRQLTTERQTMKEEQSSALEMLRQGYEREQQEQANQTKQVRMDYELQLDQNKARSDKDMKDLKQRLAEVMEEVHVLRHENYDMRTLVTDPQTQHHLAEVNQLERSAVQADSPSADHGPPSEEGEIERKLQAVRDEYECRIAALEKEHQTALENQEYFAEERHEIALRQAQVKAELDLRHEVKKVGEGMELETQRQLRLARIENERKFIEELQNARAELSARHNAQLSQLQQQYEQRIPQHAEGNSQQLDDALVRLQVENQELAEARDALLQQISTSHNHQVELQEDLAAVCQQKELLGAQVYELEQKLTVFATNFFAHRRAEPEAPQDGRHPVSESHRTAPVRSPIPQPTGGATSSPSESKLEEWKLNYNTLLKENEYLRKKYILGQAGRSPSLSDSLENGADQETSEQHLQLTASHPENIELHAVQELAELQTKYLEVVAEKEALIARMGAYIPQDSLEDLDSPLAIGSSSEEDQEMLRLRSRYTSLAEENEVLRAKLGSYGLPTEGIAEEENMDLQTRYELIMKENDALRSKLEAYTHQGSAERDGHWKQKYDAIMHDYAILRSQLEDLGLPINDSIQKGLEELQVRFDQVVKDNETLQVKLETVRENAECDFRELQARHSELHTSHNHVSRENTEFRALLEKDKDKSKREYMKMKAKLNALSKETEAVKAKLALVTREAESLRGQVDQADTGVKQEKVQGGAAGGEPLAGPPGSGVKGKKRKQERGGHGKGRKQRRESDHPEGEYMELTEQSMMEELEGLKTQHAADLKENDALKLEVGSLKCELGSLKARVMDNLRHHLRQNPGDSVTLGQQPNISQSTVGRPTSDLDLTLPEDVEALRMRYEVAMQELGDLRKELDRMNSRALDELMGLQFEAEALQEENTSMKQALHSETQAVQDRFSKLTTDGTDDTQSGDGKESPRSDQKDYAQVLQRCKNAEQQFLALKKRFQEVVSENDDLRNLIEKNTSQATDMSEYAEFRQGLMTSRQTVHSEMLVHRTNTEVTSEHMAVSKSVPDSHLLGASAAAGSAAQGQKPRCTVSLEVTQTDGVNSDVEKVDLEFVEGSEKVARIREPLSERDDMEAIESEWKRIQSLRKHLSEGRSISEEGFCPELDSSFENNKPVERFVPDSPQIEAQLVWPRPAPKSDRDLPLMPIAEEFKLQLEAMVVNFGEKNVREHLGRDYVDLHQKCQAIGEENENLHAQATENLKEIAKLRQCMEDLESQNQRLVAESRDKGEGDAMAESQVFEEGLDESTGLDLEVTGDLLTLRKEVAQLKDENELLLQENSSLLAKVESVAAKSAWEQTIIRGGHEDELEHLQHDKASLEEEVTKIKVLYMQVKEQSDLLAAENRELSGEKLRLKGELEVLRSVQESLTVEQAKVEEQIRERVAIKEGHHLPSVEVTDAEMVMAEQAITEAEIDVDDSRLSQQSVLTVEMADDKDVLVQEKSSRKSLSPGPPVKGSKSSKKGDCSGQEQGAKGGKRGGKKSPSPGPVSNEGSQGKRAGSPTKSFSSRATSPMKTLKEPVSKAKKVESHSSLRASRESLTQDERPSITQLKQKVKELASKNKSLQADTDNMRKELADRTKEIMKMKKDNEELIKEVEEIRGSLKVQSKLQDQIQDLRHRLESVSKENESLKKVNQALSDRINDAVSPPMLEFDDIKARNEELEKANHNLMEKLDRDLMQAEQELADMRDKYGLIRLEKEEIEDEYKGVKDKLEKELFNLQAKYDEAVEERDLLETQLINTREHAEKDYQQLQAGFEEMRSELEEAQSAFEGDREKARKEVTELKQKLESAKQDNEELKREIMVAKDETEKSKSGQQHQYVLLQEEKHNFQRELKDYQNRITAIEKNKDDVEKHLNDLRTRYDALEKYHEEVKSAMEEENKELVAKVNALKEEYDAQSELVKELKMEKTSLSEELNDSHAWCETLEMNLKETESHLEKEAFSLKEELHFISEKLESEQNLKSELASTEEELRQAVVETSQELKRVTQESEAIKRNLTEKLEKTEQETLELNQTLDRLQNSYQTKVSEIDVCNSELTNLKEAYNVLAAEHNHLQMSRESTVEEYSRLAGKFSTTEKHLSEFQKSVVTENKESEKLLSKFRVQFEQVTLERDQLIQERDGLRGELEEAHLQLSSQREDNVRLRQAVGSEVDIQFQTVSQIESLLGEEPRAVSPVSPLSREEVEVGPGSEVLISKLQHQNTSLAILIQQLASLKDAKEQQITELTSKCLNLESSLKTSLAAFEADRKNLEAELDLLSSQNEQLLERNRTFENQVESDTVRSRETGAEKYILELNRDILTVSTVSEGCASMITSDDQKRRDGEEVMPITAVHTEAMQISPQHSSPSVMSVYEETPQAAKVLGSELSLSLARATDSAWHAEYLALQEKYMALLKEQEEVWKRTKSQEMVDRQTFVEGFAVSISGSGISDVMEENVRLQQERTRLENELMSQRIDCLQVDAAYTELSWLKEQKAKLEQKLKLQHGMYEQEKKMLEHRLNSLQLNMDTLLTTKIKTEEEVLSWKQKYSELLVLSQGDVRELAKELTGDEEKSKLIAIISTSEKISELQRQVKAGNDENEFLRMQISHLKKECELYERHVRDLEKEVESQYVHLHEASREHKAMVQLLAETKLELELGREKHQQFSKIGETVEKIEAQMSGRSTPQLAMMHSQHHSGDLTPRAQSQLEGGTIAHSFDSTGEDDAARSVDTSKVLEEMVQLRHELAETKAIYSKEKSLLKQAQLKQVAGQQLDITHGTLIEEISVRNRHLTQERDQYQTRLKEQEDLLMTLQKQFTSTHEGEASFDEVFGQQVHLLAAQRDELQNRLQEQEEKEDRHLDVLQEKTIQEQMFHKETEVLRRKLHEKEVLEIELLHKIRVLEHHICKQQHVEELSQSKGLLEEELSQQKRTFDTELADVSKIIQDQRKVIQIERTKILKELKQGEWQKFVTVRHESEGVEQLSESDGSWRDAPTLAQTGFDRISLMKSDVERRYRDAIERLRQEIRKDFQSSSRKSSPTH